MTTLAPVPVKSGRGPRRREDILAAAVALVAARGYPAVTMEAVAAAAGAGKQTLYRWWPGRPALFVDAYTGLVPAEALLSPAADEDTAPATLLCRLFRLYRETPAAAVLAGLLGDAAGDPTARAAVRRGLMTGRQDLLTQSLAAAGAADPAWSADLVVALVWRQVLLAGPFGDADAERIAAAALHAPALPPTDGASA